MSPIAIDQLSLNDSAPAHQVLKAQTVNTPATKAEVRLPPANTQKLYAKAGIDLSGGYPYFPPAPEFVQDVTHIREDLNRTYNDPALRADPKKAALFGAATEVRDLGVHIGTEIVGLQLADLTDKQKDELALLVAERTVVFFRDQEISPQAQKSLGEYLGDGQIEKHPQAPQVPGVGGGVSLIWEQGRKTDGYGAQGKSFRHPYPYGGSYGWHTDLVHEPYPPAYTHLHQDTVPATGGDTLWASGYAAYDKFSPKFQSIIDGLNGIYRSAHKYKDLNNPDGPPVHVLRTHPLVRTNPATGWKTVFANRAMTVGIEGLDQAESDAILNHILDVYERSIDIQVRWHWTPGTSAIWDNRSSIHTVSFDHPYGTERHGTRVSSLAEKPYFDPKSKNRRQALGLPLD